MSGVYSSDLRIRVLRAIAHGQSARAAAVRFDVSPASAIRWAEQWRSTGQQTARRPGKKPDHGSKLDAHAGFIRTQIAHQRDLTLAELARRLDSERGVKTSLATLCRFLRRQGLTFKKRPRTRSNNSVRMSPTPGRYGLTRR
jgi:transposase